MDTLTITKINSTFLIVRPGYRDLRALNIKSLHYHLHKKLKLPKENVDYAVDSLSSKTYIKIAI